MQALAIGEQNKGVIRVDKLQKLHTLHNLAQLLKLPQQQLPGIPHTLRDDSLASEAQSLRDGYLAESIAKLSASDKEYRDALRGMNAAAQPQSAGTLCWKVYNVDDGHKAVHRNALIWSCTASCFCAVLECLGVRYKHCPTAAPVLPDSDDCLTHRTFCHAL